MLTMHCVIHHLVAKNLSGKLHNSLWLAVKAVNKIKRHALQTRLFKELCNENDEDFNILLQHTEVRWLSKGNCLERFVCLFDFIVELFSTKHQKLSEVLIDRKADIIYLSDLYSKFNSLNKTLQGNGLNLVKVKSALSSFKNKLMLYGTKINRRDFCYFSSLKEIEGEISDDDITTYACHLSLLQEDMNTRFKDIFSLSIPDWLLNPFEAELMTEKVEIQEDLVSLQNDFKLKPAFSIGGYETF